MEWGLFFCEDKDARQKSFLLNVSNEDKLGYEISDSIRIRNSFLIS